jgi:hypothetical protein
VPTEREVERLKRIRGRWRAICLLDDERALRVAAVHFERVLVLDPLYDMGALLYAAWHDQAIRNTHARRLAEQAALLVTAAPLLRDATAVLAPQHLPGSWDPRPGWRRPAVDAEERSLKAWGLRTALVLLHWGDRLGAVVVVTRTDVVPQVRVAIGGGAEECALRVAEAETLEEAVRLRSCAATRGGWQRARKARQLPHLACALHGVLKGPPAPRWQLVRGQARVADPALLLRRVLNDQDPCKSPPLPPTRLRRSPVFLLPAGATPR